MTLRVNCLRQNCANCAWRLNVLFYCTCFEPTDPIERPLFYRKCLIFVAHALLHVRVTLTTWRTVFVNLFVTMNSRQHSASEPAIKLPRWLPHPHIQVFAKSTYLSRTDTILCPYCADISKATGESSPSVLCFCISLHPILPRAHPPNCTIFNAWHFTRTIRGALHGLYAINHWTARSFLC